MRTTLALAVMALGLLELGEMVAWPGHAAAWDFFESENPDVEEGNALLAAGDAPGAVRAYERAVRALPGRPEVHLDHGIALLEAGQLDPAREALLRATEPPATPAIRAAAHYDLGLAFYRQGDAAASAAEADHEEATRLFREAADAFRSSLRQQPGNRDAAWNLELALRRITEQEEQEQQEEEQEEQDGEQEDGEQQDGEQEDGEQQDGEQQDGEQQDGEQAEQDQPGEGEPGQDEPGEEGADEQEPQEGRDPQAAEGEDGAEGTRDGQEGSAEEDPASTGTSERTLPPDMARVLDALEDGEESLERARARARGQREQRRVTQDW